MTDKQLKDAWIDVCRELRLSIDGVYLEAAVMLAKKAAAVERDACKAACEKERLGETLDDSDQAYENAITHCVAAIDAL